MATPDAARGQQAGNPPLQPVERILKRKRTGRRAPLGVERRPVRDLHIDHAPSRWPALRAVVIGEGDAAAAHAAAERNELRVNALRQPQSPAFFFRHGNHVDTRDLAVSHEHFSEQRSCHTRGRAQVRLEKRDRAAGLPRRRGSW